MGSDAHRLEAGAGQVIFDLEIKVQASGYKKKKN